MMQPEHESTLAEALELLPAGSRDWLKRSGANLEHHEGRLTLVTATGEQLSVRLSPSSGRPPLLKAALAGSRPPPLLADATAGMGADAFDLANAGCRVVALERSPLAWLLLRDGLRRAALDPDLEAAASRIELHHGDSRELLGRLGPFDVVYLDPMWHGGKATAGKRKPMRLLHDFGAASGDEAELLRAARAAASRRVVVKRPARGEVLAGERPSGSLAGRTVRFDLYAPTGPALD